MEQEFNRLRKYGPHIFKQLAPPRIGTASAPPPKPRRHAAKRPGQLLSNPHRGAPRGSATSGEPEDPGQDDVVAGGSVDESDGEGGEIAFRTQKLEFVRISLHSRMDRLLYRAKCVWHDSDQAGCILECCLTSTES